MSERNKTLMRYVILYESVQTGKGETQRHINVKGKLDVQSTSKDPVVISSGVITENNET